MRDPRRVAEVRRTGLLDSPLEEGFDRLTRLASRLVNAPAAFIALVDEARDFYKSTYGFGEPLESSRALTGLTFCHYAVAGSEPLVIPDTRAHPVYSQVPSVETLGVGAYLGVPLVTSGGQAIGSFCVVDFQPHDWGDLDVEVLRELADSVLREVELRLARRDARTARERAEQATRAREAILALLSHGLRNPIHTVRSSASTLLELPISDDERRRFVEIIHRNAELMTRHVADLVEIAEVGGRLARLDPAPVDPASFIEEAVAQHAAAAADRRIELRASVPADIGPVLADRGRLRQAFSKLVANAIAVTPPGEHIVVGASGREGAVTFSVTDARDATATDPLPTSLEDDWPVPDATPGGTGLSFAVVDGIVRAHGGAISVETRAGEGMTFSFTIPAFDRGPQRERTVEE